MPKLTAPRDLGPAGRALLRRIGGWLSDQVLVLDPHEETVLIEACRVADRLAQLRAALAALDLGTDAGAVRLLAEERQQRVALAGLLLTKLGLPTGVVEDDAAPGAVAGLSPSSRRARKAAGARWRHDAS